MIYHSYVSIKYDMSLMPQVRQLLVQRAVKAMDLGKLLDIKSSNLYATLGGKHDARGSTLEALAAGLDAEWVLVPKEHLPAVRQVLNGKGTGPDHDAKSAVDLFLLGRK